MLTWPGLTTIRTPPNKFVYSLIAGVLVGVIFLAFFVYLAEDMVSNKLKLLDQNITAAIIAFRSPPMTQFMKLVTNMGSATIIITIAVIAIWFLSVNKKHYWEAAVLVIALAGSYMLNNMLKLTFHRNRPTLPSLVPASGYGFPSGHAMISTAFYGMLIYLIWVNFKGGKKTYLFSLFIALLIMAIGISRIYLGVHYPSDVMAGYAAGGFWLTGCIIVLNTVRHHKGTHYTQSDHCGKT